MGQASAVSYNQPKFCPNSSWNPNATTVGNISTIGSYPYDMFINTNNTIYVPNQDNGQIIVLSEGNITSTRSISGDLLNSSSLFVTTTGDIYIDTFHSIGGVSKLTLNSTIGISRMNMCQQCWDVFIDIDNTLYCSLSERHQIIAKSLNNELNLLTIVGGTGSAGSTSNMLNTPRGIFVDITFDLYVADCRNDRIQRFQSGKLSATTIGGGGNGSLNITIILNCPTSIVLDADNNLFIVDSGNHRIVGSGVNGFQCLVGCYGSSGSASNQLSSPWALSFDSDGNIFVTDQGNNRIQKFNLLPDSCVTTTAGSAFTPSTLSCSSTVATPCTTTTTIVASCQSYEVSWNNHCYYLDGSAGICTTGYSQATNAVLTCIATQFVGKTYRSTVSNNCCVWTADTYKCYQMSSKCNLAGPFTSGPTYGCTNLQKNYSQQLTFCGSN